MLAVDSSIWMDFFNAPDTLACVLMQTLGVEPCGGNNTARTAHRGLRVWGH